MKKETNKCKTNARKNVLRNDKPIQINTNMNRFCTINKWISKLFCHLIVIEEETFALEQSDELF